VQLFQAAYNALQLPYAFIGLGRTNNYVENFYLGMPQNVKKNANFSSNYNFRALFQNHGHQSFQIRS